MKAADRNYNMLNAEEQERIRRGPHEYVPGEGKHGFYRPLPYDRSKNEYPKMMGKWPKPEHKDFLKQNGVDVPSDFALQRLQAAMIEWDSAMSRSVVYSKAEEVVWLKENG